MSDRYGNGDPVDRVNETPGYVTLLSWAALVLLVCPLIGAAAVAGWHGLAIRDGAGRVACDLTTCTPAAVTLTGLVAALIPVAWCVVYGFTVRHYPVIGRWAGGLLAFALLLAYLPFLPSNRRAHVSSTTAAGEQFLHGMALAFFTIVVDGLLVAALLWVWARREKRPPGWVWAAVLGFPVVFVALAAATNP